MPDPPAAMRERFEKWYGHAFGNDETVLACEKGMARLGYEAGWQAAQPSSEKIEAVARQIAETTDEASLNQRWMFQEYIDSIAAILREELGGRK